MVFVLRLFGAMLKYAYCYSFGILIFSVIIYQICVPCRCPLLRRFLRSKRKNIVLKLKIEQKENLQKECFFLKKTWRLFLPMPLLLPRCWDNWTWSWCRSNDRCRAPRPGEECPALQPALAAHSLHKSQRGVLFLRNWTEALRPVNFFFSPNLTMKLKFYISVSI